MSQRESRFFGLTGVLMLLCVLAGFAPSFFLRPILSAGAPPLPVLLMVHGVVFAGWVVLFVVQSLLVWCGKLGWHRQLGLLGLFVAIALVWSGLEVATQAARSGRPPGVDPRLFYAISLASLLTFALLVAAGLSLRRRGAAHKRLLFLATVVLVDPAIARLPFDFMGAHPLVSTGLAMLFWLALLVFDLATRLRPSATLLGGLPLLLSQPLALAVGRTQAWQDLVGWWLG